MNTAKILIVDDQIHALQGVSRIMHGAGYEVLEASTGMDCLRLAAEHKPDLILLDVVLPDIDGREVCKRIKSDPETSDIYVVLFSSVHIESDSQAEGLEHGADGYIARPIPNRELLARVKSILRLKYAENQLRQSEELFRAMFENHYAVMLLIEPKGGKIVNANHAAEQFYGYTVSQLCSMYIGEINILPPEEVEALRSLAIKNQQNHFVFPHRLASGEIRTVEVYAAPIKQNRKTVLFSIIHDITDKKMAEEDLKNSEERYRTIADFNYDWEYWVDAEGNFLYCSPSCKRVTGYTAQEFLDDPDLMNRIIHPHDRNEMQDHFNNVRKVMPNTVDARDFRIIRQDGEIRWIGHVCQPVYDQEGQPIGRRGSNRDITERKDVEEKLRHSEERFRNFLNSATDLVFIKDQHCRYMFVNKANQEFFGLSEQEIIGKTDFELMPQEAAYTCQQSDQLTKVTNDIIVTEEQIDNNFYEIRKFPVLVGPEEVGIGAIIRDITEQRRNQAASLESEELFRRIFEFSPVGKSMTSPDGKLLMVNKAFADMLGYTVEELQLMDFSDITVSDDLPASRECIRSLVTGERNVYRMEKRYISKDGVIVWVDLTTTLFRDPNGIPLYFLTTVLDITYRKEAEEALLRNEEKYLKLFQNAPLMYVITRNEQGIPFISDCNKLFLNSVGFARQEVIGKPLADFYSPESQTRLFDGGGYARALAGEYIMGERQVLTRDGRLIQTFLYTMPETDFSGHVTGTRAMFVDITAARKAQEAQKRLAAAIDQATEGVIITDTEGVIHYVNPAMSKITGYSAEELIGANPRILKSGEQDSIFYAQLWATIKSGKIWSGRFTNRKKNGQLYYEDATISPVKEKSGAIVNFVAVKRDITEHLELSKQLFQAQKMEAIGTLAAGVAHDFNNLLQTVLGYSELMLQRKEEGESDYANLQKIYQAGKRGADLVKSLMTFSRKVETKYVPIDLNQEITSVRKLLSRTMPRTININLHLKENLESIKADLSQIGQVLMNLGVNARDAMPDGGTLTIETANVELDKAYCAIHPELSPGAYVLLTVSDTGQGMDKETLSHIFEPFFTTKEPGKGTGLGLATVYGIVRQHGGQINCYSEPGLGTTFKIYLPAIQPEQDLQAPTFETTIPRGTETVLLVDDEDDIRDLGATLLGRFGYKVITASNGKKALEIYQKEGDGVSLVILDLIMPVLDGKKCLEEILRVNPNAKVVVASGYSDGGSSDGVMAAGAKGFVQKPYNMRQFLTTIREILDKN